MRISSKLYATLTAAVLVMTMGSGAWSAESNVDTVVSAATNPGAEAVRNIALAQQLAQYARANKDALLMIAAAKLTKEASARDSKREKATESASAAGSAAAPAPRAKPGTALSRTDQDAVSAILNEARVFAGGRKDLLAMIDEVSHVTRGAVGGPKRNYDIVNARTNDLYRVNYRGRELAAAAIITGGNPALFLQVFDEYGNPVCTDRYDGTDSLLCRWVPRWQGSFIIKVGNFGSEEGEYVLLTN